MPDDAAYESALPPLVEAYRKYEFDLSCAMSLKSDMLFTSTF